MFYLQIFSYISILFFIITIGVKIVKIISAPLHLRWELYPVPHEKNKSKYGGSRFEEVDWWQKNIKKDKLNELYEMLSEIIFMKALYKHNRPLWYASYPFHLGLYLLIVCFFFQILEIFFLWIDFNYSFLVKF